MTQNIDDVIVLDDVVSPLLFNKLQQAIVFDRNFPWFYGPGTSLTSSDDGYSFSHVVYNYEDGTRNQYTNLIHNAILTACDSFGVEPEEWHRTRLGMLTNQNKEHVHGYHVDDYYRPHHTMLLYMMDSDGDTHIKFDDGSIQRVTPKSNRAILFLGDIFHASSLPVKHQNRIAINVNFTLKGYDYGKFNIHGQT